ncbi:diacylglycerol/lipid kinase family protein [Domibacillus indicus]|uniref:diacylglycerol/lipid kinase family protein n=1 Tax=Domibacillus indicus TaxID=1437523 RepID=UPI000617D8C1|nr:YegS/Rv2252/BmrU family lipid kinase [Domibacillus indicus]
MYLFIVNPSSGNRQAVSLWKKVEKVLKEKKVYYDVLIGGSEAAVRDFVWNRLKEEKVRAVAAIGGSGTLNAILQDLVHTDTAAALLPAGSENDAARIFGLTNNPHLFVEKLLKEKPTKLDVLKVNNSFGLTVSGIGLDAFIAGRSSKAVLRKILKRAGAGGLSFRLGALLSSFYFKPFKSIVTIDGDKYVSDRTWMIACGNTSLYGGGLVICPYAHPIDGIADVTLIHSVKRSRLLFGLFPLLIRGEPIFRTGVTYKKGKNIMIETNHPVQVMIDGEQIGMTPAVIAIYEKAVNMIITAR